jgi:hypothetical protein
MLPASPCSKISRVVAIEIPNRNSVVTNNTEGKEENASGDGKYKATINSTAEIVMLMPMSTSTTQTGKGKIIMKMMATNMTTNTKSLRLEAAIAKR